MRLPVTYSSVSGPNHIYLASYKEWLTQRSVTANTLRAYHSRVKQFLLFLEYANLNEQSLDNSSQVNEAMELYLKFLQQSKSEPRSLNANINALKSFSQFLGFKDSHLKREKPYHKPAKILNAEEQKQFLKTIEQQELARDRALALVLFNTGLRIGDCAKLNVKDILIFDHSFICLPNGAKIPLNKDITLVLKQWLTERKTFVDKGETTKNVSAKNIAGEKTTDQSAAESALWLTKTGERLSISGIAFIIKRIGWQAQLIVSAEILRRTWLTNASETLNRKDLASKYGGYISAATINRYGISLPGESDASRHEH